MTVNHIHSLLESNRTEELELVLETLTKKLVAYSKWASSDEGVVGKFVDPQVLSKELSLKFVDEGEGPEGLFEDVDLLLDNSVVTWNQGFLDKLYASTNPVGMASDMLLSILNTNSHVFTVSPALTIIEQRTAREYASLFGFRGPKPGGLTFPGGSYSNMTSMHVARSILYPETKLHGNGSHKFAVFTSAHGHYSVEKSAIMLGLGSESLFKVKVSPDGRMIPEELENEINQAKAKGYTPFYVNATAGSTVYGSFDDFEAISRIAKAHGLWMHVDGSWGANVVFSKTQRHKLKGAELADSLTANPHKMLGVPTTCSFLLVPDTKTLQIANSLQAPYLFHSSHDGDEYFDLADATMGCGRRPDALKLYLAWHWYGTQGFGDRIDHAFDLTKYLAERVKLNPNFILVSEFPPPCLQTCFYYAPGGKLPQDEKEVSRITRYIVGELQKRGTFLIDYAPNSSGSGEFFRVVINSPM
jgi:glutamate decarboxylase